MRNGRRRLVLFVTPLVLIVLAPALGAYLLTRDTRPKSPTVLNELTNARRPRDFAPDRNRASRSRV